MTNKRGNVHVIVGAQYGSESKGMATAIICEKNPRITAAVRTGAINAGHTVYYKDKKYPMQQLPVTWVLDGIKSIVGRGAYVSREILEKEIAWIKAAKGIESTKKEIFVDYAAFVHLDEFIEEEKATNIHHAIGSTSEGVATAIKRKISRRDGRSLLMDSQSWAKNHPDFTLCDTLKLLNETLEDGQDVILEGTQGALLDVHFGDYPFVTSRCTNSAAWLAEAGLPPKNVITYMITRTHPIRVAGNSGPLANEIGWVDLWKKRNEKAGRDIVPSELIAQFEAAEEATKKKLDMPGRPHEIVLPSLRERHKSELSEFYATLFADFPKLFEAIKPYVEMTTVTKKLRRIAELSLIDIEYASALNTPDYIIINFLNYEFPNLEGKTDKDITVGEMEELREYIEKIEEVSGARALFGSSSAHTIINFENYEIK